MAPAAASSARPPRGLRAKVPAADRARAGRRVDRGGRPHAGLRLARAVPMRAARQSKPHTRLPYVFSVFLLMLVGKKSILVSYLIVLGQDSILGVKLAQSNVYCLPRLPLLCVPFVAMHYTFLAPGLLGSKRSHRRGSHSVHGASLPEPNHQVFGGFLSF